MWDLSLNLEDLVFYAWKLILTMILGFFCLFCFVFLIKIVLEAMDSSWDNKF